jgi:predicted KAP-like P-loop ATPase
LAANPMFNDNSELSHSDQPRQHYSEDLLGHSSFAYRLAKSISNIPCKRGTTIGLYGPWGSGKTTLINFVLAYLSELPPAEQPIVVPFNPWWFSGEEEMASRFFQNLISELSDAGVTNDILKSLKAIAELIAEVPSQFSWMAKTSGHLLSKFSERNLSKLREQAANQLLKQRRRILVLIDDADRLMPTELLTMFKLTKMTGDLPNVSARSWTQ